MDQTRSTLLVRIRDPADTKAWGEFVALYQPLLTAYVRKRGLVEEDARDDGYAHHDRSGLQPRGPR